MRACGALGQLPFVAEQMVKVFVAPLCRLGRPDDLDAACYRVASLAGAKAVPPAETLLLETRAFGLRPYMRRRGGAVSLAKGVATSDQRDGFFVIHGHPGE